MGIVTFSFKRVQHRGAIIEQSTSRKCVMKIPNQDKEMLLNAVHDPTR